METDRCSVEDSDLLIPRLKSADPTRTSASHVTGPRCVRGTFGHGERGAGAAVAHRSGRLPPRIHFLGARNRLPDHSQESYRASGIPTLGSSTDATSRTGGLNMALMEVEFLRKPFEALAGVVAKSHAVVPTPTLMPIGDDRLIRQFTWVADPEIVTEMSGYVSPAGTILL